MLNGYAPGERTVNVSAKKAKGQLSKIENMARTYALGYGYPFGGGFGFGGFGLSLALIALLFAALFFL